MIHSASLYNLRQTDLLQPELNIIAEGTETEGENQMLKKLGCEMGQGYLFANQYLRRGLGV